MLGFFSLFPPVRVLLQLSIIEFCLCPVHQFSSAGHSQCLASSRIPRACTECVWQVSTAADAVWKCQTCCNSAHNPFWILNFTPNLLENAAGGGQIYLYCSSSDKPLVVEGFKPEREGTYCSFIISWFSCLYRKIQVKKMQQL